MAKPGVSLVWGGFDTAVNGLASRTVSQKSMLMAEIGEALISGTVKRFEKGEDPQGNKWEPSERAWMDGVTDGRFGKTLVDTGRLRDSVDYAVTPDSVMVGSNVEYARIHQKGGTIRPKKGKYLKFKGGGGQDVFVKEVTIPARPYLGVSKEDMEELQDILANFLAAPFQGKK